MPNSTLFSVYLYLGNILKTIKTSLQQNQLLRISKTRSLSKSQEYFIISI